LSELSAILGSKTEAISFNSARTRCCKHKKRAGALTGRPDLSSETEEHYSFHRSPVAWLPSSYEALEVTIEELREAIAELLAELEK
jgi:hypothetical protein